MERRPDNAFIIGIAILSILFSISPFTIIPIAVIGIIVFILTRTNNSNPNFNIQNQNRGTTYSSRQTALENVRFYIAPYQSMWKDLRISNKFCSLRLGRDGTTITGSEKVNIGRYRKFRIVESKIHSSQEIWDMFCLNFDYQTTYNRLLELCNIFRVVYTEDVIGGNEPLQAGGDISLKNEYGIKTDINTKNSEKLDINNATEVEITSLPGISIVLSKKIIKRREEIGGFKTVDDLFKFLKLKPHMENQLRPMICVKKMKGSVQIQRNSERSVDL